jgi:hypothetical protein
MIASDKREFQNTRELLDLGNLMVELKSSQAE